MSGLTGLYHRSGVEVTGEELDAMVDMLAHRGPDGRGTWRERTVGLGHQQLRTTPEDRYATLPAVSDDGEHVLTMDARVDNRRTLCDALGLDECPTLTDAELLLTAYDDWGVECFERIVGAYAVAIYDRVRDCVVCARDATGIKPLYYALTDDLFAFGSEPKAVRSLQDVPETLDDASVFAFLADEFRDPEATFFEGVARLPPGQVLRVSSDEVQRWRYWSAEQRQELDLPSDGAYEERFREVFTEAIRCRLRRPAGTKLASSLSGGLDSTAVACVAQSLLDPGEAVRTLSVTHEGYPRSDESEYLRTALDAYDFDSHVVDGGGESPFLDLDERLAHHDTPFYPPLFVNQQLFADELADEKHRVLLDGLGGDQVLHYGTSHLPELLLEGSVGQFAAELDALAEQIGTTRTRVLFDHVAGPLAPQPVRRAWRHYHGLDDLTKRYPLLDADAALDAGFDAPTTGEHVPATNHRDEHRRSITDAEQGHFIEVVDVELAKVGVEPRYPYYDRRVVEFCLALPLDQKIRRGVGRQILRRALSGTVPEPVLTRSDKASLGQSWLDGLHRHEREHLRERLVVSPKFVDRYVDEEFVTSTFREFAEDSSPSLDEAWPLVKAYAVETWLRTSEETH